MSLSGPQKAVAAHNVEGHVPDQVALFLSNNRKSRYRRLHSDQLPGPIITGNATLAVETQVRDAV